MAYQPQNAIRIVTAAALFDGHDAAINIIRRVLQDLGAEVIHLGHNRSVQDVVDAALQEGAQGICVSSYQGGHMEYFKYMRDSLNLAGADYVQIYGGGGGVIVHKEKAELEAYGIAQIFHPDDGRRLGLEGMIESILRGCDFDLSKKVLKNPSSMTQLGFDLTKIENGTLEPNLNVNKKTLVLGITGTGGAGKSSLIDELVSRFLNTFADFKVGVICVDPTKKKTGGALLGDRIRINSLSRPNTFMRSVASRHSGNEIANALPKILSHMKSLDFDLLIAESSGIGQASSGIVDVSDFSLYVMTSEFGAQSQLEKIDMIDYADFIAINKADRRGAEDAFRDVVKQYKRSRKIFDLQFQAPVFLTQASNFNDHGLNLLFYALCEKLGLQVENQIEGSQKRLIVPSGRQNYLGEIVKTVRDYKSETHRLQKQAKYLEACDELKIEAELYKDFPSQILNELKNFKDLQKKYSSQSLSYHVREQKIEQSLTKKSLSGIEIPRVVVPRLTSWVDRLQFLRLENVPGVFPFTAGVFPLKKTDEDTGRQFAGEGPPERTNKRFHYLSQDQKFKRLSTAFDSVTLYGQDPDERPDIFGKVGESGVSISTLEDMKKLYQGFDLCDPLTSVSMTINGPAPMILAFFMNTAIDAEIEKSQKQLGRPLNQTELVEIQSRALSQVRGTVQADILKEDQGQNTCIFSIDFALKMMGDIQEYFVNNSIRNFYSVSISGYHIAEAGANPITQLALTLSNAFTYIEYYLSRGLKIDEFAPNLSFFFSNGLDPEYMVIGRVARRIWAITLRDKYKASERSQKLKYHIQTSGRSLHAQEISFNDIRTTLQALVAINDNCNSLHTNAYDEAITTPTEESVRRAQAIQLIINKEFGMTINQNPFQGSYFIEWLTDQVEEAVLKEFDAISERGGVLAAMETQYQRAKIQEESLYYEMLKHDGSLPIVGVNTFVDPKTLDLNYQPPPIEMARATLKEKQDQLKATREWKEQHLEKSQEAFDQLKNSALHGENIFESLLKASRVLTLGQMSEALYEVGGQYRRNL